MAFGGVIGTNAAIATVAIGIGACIPPAFGETTELHEARSEGASLPATFCRSWWAWRH